MFSAVKYMLAYSAAAKMFPFIGNEQIFTRARLDYLIGLLSLSQYTMTRVELI